MFCFVRQCGLICPFRLVLLPLVCRLCCVTWPHTALDPRTHALPMLISSILHLVCVERTVLCMKNQYLFKVCNKHTFSCTISLLGYAKGSVLLLLGFALCFTVVTAFPLVRCVMLTVRMITLGTCCHPVHI